MANQWQISLLYNEHLKNDITFRLYEKIKNPLKHLKKNKDYYYKILYHIDDTIENSVIDIRLDKKDILQEIKLTAESLNSAVKNPTQYAECLNNQNDQKEILIKFINKLPTEIILIIVKSIALESIVDLISLKRTNKFYYKTINDNILGIKKHIINNKKLIDRHSLKTVF